MWGNLRELSKGRESASKLNAYGLRFQDLVKYIVSSLYTPNQIWKRKGGDPYLNFMSTENGCGISVDLQGESKQEKQGPQQIGQDPWATSRQAVPQRKRGCLSVRASHLRVCKGENSVGGMTGHGSSDDRFCGQDSDFWVHR